jgi:leucine dehydrogenase
MNITSTSNQVLNISPREFADKMTSAGISRGYLVNDNLKVMGASNIVLNPLAEAVSRASDFANHEAILFMKDDETNCLFFVFVHNTVRGQAQGGTRLMSYETIGDVVSDGLRLSRAMTEKNAVAEIWWGGGKAIICPLNGLEDIRKTIFINYGKFVASLNGAYVAAEDMNTTPTDMQTILSVCRYVTCLPPVVGGSSNPSIWTARGVFKSMLATIKYYEGSETLVGKTVGIQGVGNVGMPLAKFLLDAGANLIVYDTNPIACDEIKNYASNVLILDNPKDIYTAKIDIFSPCARGGVVNVNTIPLLKAKYIIGAANNQLLVSPSDADNLFERKITYLPDFFINRMGIINCANEQYGRLDNDLNEAVEKVYSDTEYLLSVAEKRNVPPLFVANEMAKSNAKIEHPIWGHRGLKLLHAYLNYVKKYS